MDIISYAASKKIAEGAVSGVASMSVSGQTLTINCTDGTVLTMTFPTPADGVSITNVDVRADKHLIVTLSDDNTIDAGEVPTVKGDKGDKGDTGVGVPEGGTEGQVLVKKSSTDYDTEWGTPAGGGDMLKSVYDTDNDGKVNSAENADTVDGHTVAKDVPADAKFTDTVYDDTEIRGEIADKVDKVDGKGLSTNDYTNADKTIVDGVTSALAGKADVADIPSKTSDLTNDSGFITKAVNDLVSYYLKSETYSKTEVDDIVTAIKNSRFEVVATLPTTDIKTNVIYLVPKSPSQTSNVKDEYINLDGTSAGWEKIGDTEIDLSDYVTTEALNTALAAYTTTADLTTLLAGKQDTLTFDNAPTENSNNPVKSGGIYADEKAIYQVMGQNSAKNFIPFDLDKIKAKNTTGTWNGNVYSLNGIDFTFNSDGTVDASGTATETASVHYYDPAGLPPFGGDRILRLTGCPSGGGSGTTYKVMAYRAAEVDGSAGTAEDYGDGISLKWLNNGSGIKAFISISVYTGAGTIDVTFKPMLRLSTDTDNTFAPYAKTNQQLTAENQTLTNNVDVLFETGVKNICPPYLGSYSSNGITYIGNSDGTVTANGTCSANVGINIRVYLKAGQYKVSGCPRGGSYSTYRIGVTTDSWTLIGTHDHGNGTTITIPSDGYYRINLDVRAGYVANNLVFKPMITDVDTPESDYDHYVPYAKTNQELTVETQALTNQTNGIVNVLGAKNVLPFPYYEGSGTYNGVTITDNGDGSITLDGTCTGMSFFVFYGGRYSLAPTTFVKKNEDYIATLEVVSGSMAINSGTSRFVFRNYITNATSPFVDIFYEEKVIDTRSVKFTYEPTASYDTSLVWYEFNVGTTFNNWRIRPMFRLASITDDTYEPYVPTNKELMSCKLNGYVGAKNLLAYPYKHTTKSENGVTFTDNGDGTITVNTPTSASAETTFYLSQSIQSILDTGMYILSGCPSGGDRTSGYFMEFAELATSSSNWKMFGTDTGEGAIAHIDSTRYAIHAYIRIRSGATVSNLTFKPMIRRVEDTDPTWQPYAKTNKELTEDVDTINNNGFLQANSYCFYCSANSSAIDAYAQSLGITTSTTFSEVINILKNNIRYNATRFTVSTNDANLSSSASQLLKDLCGFFGITACAVLSFDVKVIDTYNQRVEIMLTDKNLNNIKIVRVTNGTAGTVKTIALS